jgi:outer membrane protein
LNDLFRIALERSEKVGIASAEVAFSEQEKNRALSVLMPRLSAFANYQKYSNDKYNDYDTLIQPKSVEQWGLRADQAFSLSLRELTMLSEARSDIVRARYDLAYVKEVYLLQVAQAYYNVLLAKKGVDIARSNLERLVRYRDAANVRLEVGEITKTVVLRAESELSGAKSDLVRSENALTLARAALARVVGLEGGFSLKEEPPRQARTESLPELKDIAYSERADLKSLEYQMKIAKLEISYARGAYWPNLAIAGVFQRTDQEPETLTLNTESSYGALSLNFPFFEGGLRRAEVQEAKIREHQSILQYEDQKKTVGIEVETAYLDLLTQKETLKYLEDHVAFARDNYRGVSRQFEMGLASSIDVIDANNLLVSSERQVASAVYSYQLAILAVEQATGTLLREVGEKAIR